MRIELIVPGLLGPRPGGAGGRAPAPDARSKAVSVLLEGLALPALEQLLANARFARADLQADRLRFARHYFSVYALHADRPPSAASAHTRAMAALSREHECGDAGEAVWMRADPVQLVADLRTVRLAEFENLDLSGAELDELLQTVNAYSAEWGVQIEASPNGTCYLRCAEAIEMHSIAPLSALGQDIRGCLPRGAAAPLWVSRDERIADAAARLRAE